MQGRTNSTSVYSKNTDATFTENGVYVPSEGFTGFGVVTVDTPTASDLIMQEDFTISPAVMDFTDPNPSQYSAYTAPYVDTQAKTYDGVANIKVRKIGPWIDNEINQDHILRGHTILGVTGNVVQVHNQANKNARATSQTVEVTPDNGYTGLDKVTISPLQTQTKSITINQTEQTQYPYVADINKDSAYDGMTRVTVTVNAPPEPPPPPVYVTKKLEIEPKVTAKTFDPATYGADGFGPVNVAAVTSSIDDNIQDYNIAPGVTILGITGNYTPQNLENVTVTPSKDQDIVVEHSSGYEALGQVLVERVTHDIDENITASNIKEGITILGVPGEYHGPDYRIDTRTNVTPLVTSQTITPRQGYDYLDSVQIDGVTSEIDKNIIPSNIKEGVTILNTLGTYKPQEVQIQSVKTVTPSTAEQNIFPDEGYDAIAKLIVKAITDPNLLPENIRKNITILGVRGSLDAKQKWFDFQDLSGFTVLTSDTFGNGQFAPELEAGLTDYVITSQFIDLDSEPIENLSAIIFSKIIGYDNLEVTDPIIYQSYIYFVGGYYYTDYSNFIRIEDQISYLYPVTNNDNINGCLLNCNDTCNEKVYNLYVILGSKQAKPVLVDGTITGSMLPDGYTSFRYVGTITVPAHNLFTPVEAVYSEKYDLPILTGNGVLGGNTFAVAASSTIDTARQAWRAFDKSNKNGEIDCWHATTSFPQWLEWYFPIEVYIDKIYISNRIPGQYNVNTVRDYQIQISSDNSNWTTIYSGRNLNYESGATWTIDLTGIPFQNRISQYWRIYITSNDSQTTSGYVCIGELDCDAYYYGDEPQPVIWEQPVLSTATSYGVVSNGNIAAGSDEGYKVFTNENTVSLVNYIYTENEGLATVTGYSGSETIIKLPGEEPVLANFIPETTGSYIKWQMPDGIKLSFSAGISTIRWCHNSNNVIMSGTPLQLFADENKTIPLTTAFADTLTDSEGIIIPVITDIITDTIYISIAEHENYGGIGKIYFNNVYITLYTSAGTTQSWLLNDSLKQNVSGTFEYNNSSELSIIDNNITFYTEQNNQPLAVSISAFDVDYDKPTILSEKEIEITDLTPYGNISLQNGLVSNYSQTNYISAPLVLSNNVEITLRAYLNNYYTAYQYLISDSSGSGFGIYMDSSSSYSYYCLCDVNNVTRSGTSAFNRNTWNWIKLVQSGTTTKIYAFQDTGTYTSVDDLPDITDSTWVQKVTINTQIFKGNTFFIGTRYPEQTSTEYYFRNSIDLSNFKIKVNGYEWKPYKTEIHSISNHVIVPRQNDLYFVSIEDAPTQEDFAHIYGYTDTGAAITINAYGVYDKKLNKRTYLFALDDNVEFETETIINRFEKLGFAGTIDIPEHTAYRYDIDTQTWIPKE